MVETSLGVFLKVSFSLKKMLKIKRERGRGNKYAGEGSGQNT